VNAKDRLRRYLEQRRDMGETELLLDSMTVEDVMRAIGAIDQIPATSAGSDADAEGGADWRNAMRDASSSSGAIDAFAVPTELFDDDVMRLNSLKSIETAVAQCTRCPLYKTALNGVPGEGDPKARLVCVGEAPGASEDETGRPFVGAAGGLLTKILAAVDLRREDVFICNVIKHRPPGNRNPMPDEVAACSPYLVRQIEIIKPKVIVAFGTFAAQTLLDTKTPIGKLRGLVHQYHGIPLVVTYHPAALLRNSAWKRPTWEDVKLARRILDKPAGA
jgi:uracil-DNA glycosylase family 4